MLALLCQIELFSKREAGLEPTTRRTRFLALLPLEKNIKRDEIEHSTQDLNLHSPHHNSKGFRPIEVTAFCNTRFDGITNREIQKQLKFNTAGVLTI